MAKTNKYALVTGGSRGIGREICLKLGGCGYHVLVNYKSNAAEAEKTLAGIRAAGGDGEALQFDVASGEESTAAIEAWQKAHEGACIEVVVNNAGIRDDVLMMWMEPQQWHSVIGTSLDGFYNVTRPLLKGMLVNRFGRIVNIVSLSGIKGLPGQANYAAAKGGVIACLLPATSFCLGSTYAPAREMVSAGVPVAMASDFNPGSCPCLNLQFVINLGCLRYRLTPEEVLTAVTLNAAAAIDMADRVGSVEAGKQGDLVIWDAPDLDYICYRFGSNLVQTVIKKGRLV